MNPITAFIKREKKRKQVLAMNNEDLDKEVKIEGTQYDRKRRYTDAEIKKWRKLYNNGNGMTISELSHKFDVPYNTIHYHVDDLFKLIFNKNRDGSHTGVDTITMDERATYKRQLLKRRKIRVSI